jgi:hypothetical protein
MRKFNIALGIFAVAGTLGALWCWQQLQSERIRAADLEQKLAALQLQADRAPGLTPPAMTEQAEKPQAESTPTAARAKSENKPAARDQEVRNYLHAAQQREREMLRDPAYRKSQLEAGRRQFAQLRADAIRVVGMTPEQADRVIDLWVERNFRFADLGGVPGEEPTEAMQAELKRAADAEQSELRSLLGEEKYGQWNRYLSSGEERAEVGQFRSQLAATADPLRDNQADALVDAIYSERQRRSSEYEEYVKTMGITDRYVVSPQDRQRWLDLEKEANQRIHDTVAGTLSRSQLARLDEMLAARLVPVETALRLQLEGKLAKSN